MKLECPECKTTFILENLPPGREVTCPVCEYRFIPLASLPVDSQKPFPPGTAIGGCAIESLIGAGGMGKVYRARHLRLERTVALKILEPELVRKNPKYAERFLSEAKAGAQINHPNVVHIYDAGHEGDYYYIQSAYVQGRTLRKIIVERGRLQLDWACDIFEQCIRGLNAVHKADLLHRDVKPNNFMLSADGIVELMDFGLAKPAFTLSEMTTTGFVMGTPTFMSPEQCEGDELDLRSDIYSLGLVFWTVLIGHKPFGGVNSLAIMKNQREAPLPSVGILNPDVPEPLDKIIHKMAAKKPEDRYFTLDQVYQDFRAFLEGKPLVYAGKLVIAAAEREAAKPEFLVPWESGEKDAAGEPRQEQTAPPLDGETTRELSMEPRRESPPFPIGKDELLVEYEEIEDITEKIKSELREKDYDRPAASTSTETRVPPEDEKDAIPAENTDAPIITDPLPTTRIRQAEPEIPESPEITDPTPTIRLKELDDREQEEKEEEEEPFFDSAAAENGGTAPYAPNIPLRHMKDEKPLWMQSGDIPSAEQRSRPLPPEQPRILTDDSWKKAVKDAEKMRISTAERESVIAARRKTAEGHKVMVVCRHCGMNFPIMGEDIGTTQPCPKCGLMTPYEPPGLFIKNRGLYTRRILYIFLGLFVFVALAFGIFFLFPRGPASTAGSREQLLDKRLKDYYHNLRLDIFEETYNFEKLSVDKLVDKDTYIDRKKKKWLLLDIKREPGLSYKLQKDELRAVVTVQMKVGFTKAPPERDQELTQKEVWVWVPKQKNWFHQNSIKELEEYR